MRVAIPFSSGTTFAVTLGYSSTEAAPAASLGELSATKPWFFDSNAKLLWLHFETIDREWTYRGLNPHYPQVAQVSLK